LKEKSATISKQRHEAWVEGKTHIEAWVEGKDYNIDALLDLKGKLINENRDILRKIIALDEKRETNRIKIRIMEDDIKLQMLKDNLANKQKKIRNLKLSIAQDKREIQLRKIIALDEKRETNRKKIRIMEDDIVELQMLKDNLANKRKKIRNLKLSIPDI